MKINKLSDFRYSITNVINDGANLFAVPQLSIPRMIATYNDLIQKHISELEVSCKAKSFTQVQRNHLTALRGFLKRLGKTEASAIGSELSEEFEPQLEKYLQTCELSGRSLKDRKSLLIQWRNTRATMTSEPVPRASRQRPSASIVPEELNPFERAFREALASAKMTPKAAARLAGCATSAVSRWTRGAIPNIRSTSSFSGLEQVLAVTPGTLSDAFKEATNKRDSSIAYRQRLGEHRKLKYRLLESEVSLELHEEWQAYFEFKTSRFEKELESSAARWSTVDPKKSTLRASPMWCINGKVCATASITWAQISAYLGFLRLEKELGGLGLSTETVQTLAWLSVPETVDAFMRFKQDRSDGIIHRGHMGFAMTVLAMNHPTHGYLTQCPQMLVHLPGQTVKARTWSQLCKSASKLATSWKSEARGKSRDPATPIQFLLNMEEPLSPIFSMMGKIRRLADRAVRGSMDEAVARRDELLIGLLVSNPLRVKNLILLTYEGDNSGDIYKSAVGAWRIRIDGDVFKNRSRVGNELYDVPVAGWLSGLLTQYVERYRPILKGQGRSSHLFLNTDGERFDKLSATVSALTKRWLPETEGFASHSFRHLVASDWLTKNPNDFLTISELLNDSVTVVMNEYAHLKKSVAFDRYEAYVQKVLPEGMRV